MTMTAISFFSGAGGMNIGMSNAGFDIVMNVENDPYAIETLNANAKYMNNVLDEQALDFNEFELYSGRPKDIDAFFCSPPSQGFSSVGKMDAEDERNEYIVNFFHKVMAYQPKTFMVNTVKGFAKAPRHANLRNIIREIVTPTYRMAMIVVDADRFGVPQSRQHTLIIGMHRDLFGGSHDDFRGIIQTALRRREHAAPTAGEVLRTLDPVGTENHPLTCDAIITYCRQPVMRRSPYAGMLFNGQGRPVGMDRNAPTLTASMGGNKTPIIDENALYNGALNFAEVYHSSIFQSGEIRRGQAPDHLRRMTVKEAAALQTFPKDYVFSGPTTAQYRQIGNAMPVALATEVADVVAYLLDTYVTAGSQNKN